MLYIHSTKKSTVPSKFITKIVMYFCSNCGGQVRDEEQINEIIRKFPNQNIICVCDNCGYENILKT